MKKTLFITLLLVAFLSGCKKDPDPVETKSLPERARDGLYELMQVMYLWNDKMPTVKASDYGNPEDLLKAMRYLPIDKWSFVMTYEEFMALMGGSFVGHGITTALDTANVVRVVSLYKNSDLWPKGVRRGWIVKQVNGIDLAPVFINAVRTGDWTAYDNLMGSSTAGIKNIFLFKKPDGTEVTYSSTKASFTINSVTAYDILDLPSGKTGYLCFETFINPSEAELNEAFAFFKANNVTDLIIDLRYNTGGDTYIAQQLASLVLKQADTTKICFKLKYNSTVSATWNESYKFIKTDSPLGLDRVVFITTRSSASASEVVINSLKSWVAVSIVGDTTYGKPVGMDIFGYPFPQSSTDQPDYKYVFGPITFEYVNASDEGYFYDGMLPDVLANDDITRDFGDPEELSLKAAIAVLEGTKAGSAVPLRHNIIRSEGNQLPADLFLMTPKSFRK